MPGREFAPSFDPGRASLIRVMASKWVGLPPLLTSSRTDGQNVLLPKGNIEWRTWQGDRDQSRQSRNTSGVTEGKSDLPRGEAGFPSGGGIGPSPDDLGF